MKLDKILTTLATLLLMCVGTYAQTDSLRLRFVYEGTVRDAVTGKVLQYVGVSVPGRNFATVTNVDGDFIIKSDESASELTFSLLGYKSLTLPVPDEPGTRMRVSMAPQSLTLHEAMIISADPYSLVDEAIKRIPVNYSLAPELHRSFYRETVQKRQKYVYISEAVSDIYKTSYAEDVWRDNVSIDKSRVLLSQKASDTLTMKVLGGPTQCIICDIVKSPRILLDKYELAHYELSMDSPTTIGGKLQFVVNLAPREIVPYALFYGKIYIDQQSLAFTRFELFTDMSDEVKA
ncbi:MAG: carboxypeptidase-like regulatory domain-containing protein, partial [Bacteroidales bacterium]|nr:carboxypeptidase-like regulatory domain-containing protein [Bacteroidales bacterium]